MQCLMCQKEMEESRNYYDLLFSEDLLCKTCREQWKEGKKFQFHGVDAYADYIYNDAFSDCLVQMKELGDEALKDVFLWNQKKRLRRMYRGYTLALLPSSKSKVEHRGFSHLREIYGCLGLPMIEPFEKLVDEDQKKLNQQEREKMEGKIRLKENVILPRKIVLCDDVLTTGSTMKGALSCIKNQNLKIKIHVCSIVELKKKDKYVKKSEYYRDSFMRAFFRL